MSDSVVETNIPVRRMPFAAGSVPPNVPYMEGNNVGVEDTTNTNLPVQVKNRKIVPVGDKSDNAIRAVYLKRKSSGKTEADVPTSDTPNADDPGTMIATKEYVDNHAAVTNGLVRYSVTLTPCKVRDRANVDIVSSNPEIIKLSQVIDILPDKDKRYGVYTVQSDCVLGIWAGANNGHIGSEIATVWMKCANVAGGGANSYTWIVVNQFVETIGGLDNNRRIFINVCAGTQFRFAFGKQKFSVSTGSGKVEVARGTFKGSGGFSPVAAATGVVEGSANDYGKIIFTEFALSATSQSGEGGSDDPEGGGEGGGGSVVTINTDPIPLLNIDSPQVASSWSNITVKTNPDTGEIITGATPDGVTPRNYTCTRTTTTVDGVNCYTYTFTIPSIGVSQIGIDFCCDDIQHSKMIMKVGDSQPSLRQIALSQNYPNNVSGFQMFVPSEPFSSGDNIYITIERAQAIEHANVWIYRTL